MNKLDDKMIIRKSHLAALCAMLNPLDQNQDRVASEAIRLLYQDLTGWMAVPTVPTQKMTEVFNAHWYNFGHSLKISIIPLLEASPPLPGTSKQE